MKLPRIAARTRTIALLAVMACASSQPVVAEQAVLPKILVAVMQGDCQAAVELVNRGVDIGDGQAVFWGARMLDEGICTPADRPLAAKYYARASELGSPSAALEYAALVGLGQGAEQSYERAGEICRQGGVDPQSRFSTYELGYACTLRAMTGRQVRQTIPPRALQLPAPPARVGFHPSSAELEVLSIPSAAPAPELPIGSHIHTRRTNLRQTLQEAWETAAHTAPKPDAARLGAQVLELAIDVDTSLETGPDESNRNKAADSHLSLTPGDVHRTTSGIR